MGFSTVEETTEILWATLQSHKEMAELSKQDIKRHPSITYIFVRLIIIAKVYEPLQDISQMKKDIKVLSTKSDHHHGRLTQI